MILSTTQAKGLLTETLVDIYKLHRKPNNFLRGFFKEKTTPSAAVSIAVERGLEKVAVDVVRGSLGNRNAFSLSTEKTIVPPYYREYFDVTDLQLYDRLFGAVEVSDAVVAAFAEDVVEKRIALENKINRSYELQCAQALTTGIVQLTGGISINFNRKAGSLVDPGASAYFAAADSDPFALFTAGAGFLRNTGKSGDAVFNAILGSTALANLFANTKFLNRQNLFNLSFDAVTGPARDNNTGADYHGTITAGSYKIQLWSYSDTYDDASNVATPYIDPKQVIMFPANPRFILAYGAVPQLAKPGSPVKQGKFVWAEYIDEREASHVWDVKSAGVAIPVAIDQIYTFKAVA